MNHPWRALAKAQEKQRSRLAEYHGGPVEKLETKSRSAHNRGLAQTTEKPKLHTKIVMSAGQIQMAKRFQKIKQQVLASRALLDAQAERLSPRFFRESPVTAERVSGPSEARSPKPNPDQPARPEHQGAEELMTKEPCLGR